MVEVDGIILGSPVYSADVSAKMKAFLERAGVVVATNPGLLRHKVGASVAAVRCGGGMISGTLALMYITPTLFTLLSGKEK